MPRFLAKRFAVPAGTTAIVVAVVARASMQRWSIPSPPQTKRRSVPSAIASLTFFGACLLFETSYQRGASTPSLARTARNAGRPPPSDFPVWARTPTDVTFEPPSVRGVWVRRRVEDGGDRRPWQSRERRGARS